MTDMESPKDTGEKPREFWLFWHDYYSSLDSLNRNAKFSEAPFGTKPVHVIEYDAYEYEKNATNNWAKKALENKAECLGWEKEVLKLRNALSHIARKVPEKVSREEAADMAVEFKQIAEKALKLP